MQMGMRINAGSLYITDSQNQELKNVMGLGVVLVCNWLALAFVIVLLIYEHVIVFMHINVQR